MLEKLENIEKRFAELEKQLFDPAVVNDMSNYQKIAKEHNDLQPVMEKIKEYREVVNQLNDDLKVIEENSDPELVELAEMEVDDLREQQTALEDELKLLLVPKDPEDEKNCIVEIRAGTGGDEAGIFAGDLYRMYQYFCEKNKYKIDVMNTNPAPRGGFKEIIFQVSGPDAYGKLKFESGVHRVQRVPETETQGRIHTSAASVVVLPEVEDVDVDINPNDLKIDVYRSSGPGGQSVNTTDSAVRITHLPTGMVVTCQDEKSQHKNKAKALKVLNARLYDMALQEQQQEIAAQRKTMVGTGDRSAKIRTYNFPQGRVTDHRINLTLYKLDDVLQGNLEEFIEKMQLAEQAARLEAETSLN
jgi:peptide chain release factor 1